MNEIIQLIGAFALLFAGCLVVSASITHLLKKKRTVMPLANGVSKLNADSGSYRARFLGVENGLWVFSAPIKSDSYVPFRVGEQLVVETPTEGGAILYRTNVAGRELNPHRILLSPPGEVAPRERRLHGRAVVGGSPTARIEGSVAEVQDASAGGVRAVAAVSLPVGSRVSVSMGEMQKQRTGWILESVPHSGPKRLLRIRFEPD